MREIYRSEDPAGDLWVRGDDNITAVGFPLSPNEDFSGPVYLVLVGYNHRWTEGRCISMHVLPLAPPVDLYDFPEEPRDNPFLTFWRELDRRLVECGHEPAVFGEAQPLWAKGNKEIEATAQQLIIIREAEERAIQLMR